MADASSGIDSSSQRLVPARLWRWYLLYLASRRRHLVEQLLRTGAVAGGRAAVELCPTQRQLGGAEMDIIAETSDEASKVYCSRGSAARVWVIFGAWL